MLKKERKLIMKKIVKLIAWILAFSIVFSVSAFAADDVKITENQEDSTSAMGDISGDGRVSILDSAYAFFHVIGLRKLNEEQLAVGDVNCDGKISFDDMREITQYALNMTSTFTAEESLWQVAGEPVELEKDENGEYLYRLPEMYKEIGVNSDSNLVMSATYVSCNGSTQEQEIVDMTVGSDENRMYTEFNIRKMGDFSLLLNMLKLRVISENGSTTLVLPSINAYITDTEKMGLDFSSMVGEFKTDPNYEYDYANNYYSRSYSLEFGGTQYICEEYNEPYYTVKYYFTTNGELKRSEAIKKGNPDYYRISIFDYIGTDMDENMFDIPIYYIKISVEDLKKFIGENQGLQYVFKDIIK